ncbi:MAG: two-component system, OmpR family, sensor kinase, partial [Nocardioidaceae bacterium]|nr:two-component system, OmpR family, sensor kinase [Nocardioidaceae bacterium]
MSIDPRTETALDAAAQVAVDVVNHVDRSEPVAQLATVVALDESTSWADGTTHQALLVIAEGITQLAGFEVAAVSVVRDSQHMQVMAVAGSDQARDILLGTFTPITRLMEELQHAEDWGMFQFVPHESLDPESESWGWVPDLEPVSGPDAWHPMDLLVAPLYGPNGELRGSLSIDCPTDGRRPDDARRRILNRYAEQAGRALYIAVEREAFAEQVRVLSATREVVRNATRERNIGVMLEKIQPSLIEGFRSLGSWIHTVDEDGHGLGAIYTGNGGSVQMPPDLVAMAERAAADSWRAQQVGVLTRHLPHDPRVSSVSEPEFKEILRFLEGIGVGSVLFVPMGAGRECLGSLVLTRALGDAEWTPAELDAALEVGRDLGRAVLNARALDRERELVRELKALDEYKTKLIATLSHELKSPLAAMLANIEFLEETVDLDEGGLAVL